MDQSPAWKANSLAGAREIPCVMRNPGVDITTFARARCLSLSWAGSVRFTPFQFIQTINPPSGTFL